mmetsp:Transcript_28632/g.94128  ORF Transcript_28632/g.94128 Transcript_28632/m.94128 type:complete len:395 (+) Transcript_28632:1541-2725(+)
MRVPVNGCERKARRGSGAAPLPHEVAVAKHPRQDHLPPERLSDAEQRADHVRAVPRLLQVVLDRVARVDPLAHLLARQRGVLGRGGHVLAVEVLVRVDEPEAVLSQPLPLAVREGVPFGELVRHVHRHGRGGAGQRVRVLHEVGVPVEEARERQHREPKVGPVGAGGDGEESLDAAALNAQRRGRAHLCEHVEGGLVSDAVLLCVGDRLSPQLRELDRVWLGAQVDEPGVEVAVHQRRARVEGDIDAVGGDGDVCEGIVALRHQRARVMHEDGVGVARPHVVAEGEQLAVEAHLEHAHLRVQLRVRPHVAGRALLERRRHVPALDEDARQLVRAARLHHLAVERADQDRVDAGRTRRPRPVASHRRDGAGGESHHQVGAGGESLHLRGQPLAAR